MKRWYENGYIYEKFLVENKLGFAHEKIVRFKAEEVEWVDEGHWEVK